MILRQTVGARTGEIPLGITALEAQNMIQVTNIASAGRVIKKVRVIN